MAAERQSDDINPTKASAKKLLSLHRLGLSLMSSALGPLADRMAALQKRALSDKYGFSDAHPETARRALRLVSPGGFTPDQVQELIALARAKIRGNVFFIVWAAMAAPPRSRLAIARQALEQGWSARELQRQLTARFGRRGQLGRHRGVAANPLGKIGLIESATTSWMKMACEISVDSPSTEGAPVTKLPPAIVRQLHTVIEQMTKLQKALERHIAAAQAK